MTDRNDKSEVTPPLTSNVMRASAQIPPAVMSLQRALLISAEYDWCLDLEDIQYVETMWELLDLDSTSHGFVLHLRDGGRCYLQYVTAPEGDGAAEDVEMLPMGNERYPEFRGIEIDWSDDVEALNHFLGDVTAGQTIQ